MTNARGARQSFVYLGTMALAGAGCAFLGPLLPTLSTTWHLQDRQAGSLISSFFAGSFFGSMLLSNSLERTLYRGSALSAAGLLGFTIFAQTSGGYVGGAAALIAFGLGLGQLMSSINLLVGKTPVEVRTRHLANLGSAWCCGAIMSPLLAVGSLGRASSIRLGSLAGLYILPLLFRRATMPITPHHENEGTLASRPVLRILIFWVVTFLIYGGIEVSMGGWIPSFASRYQPGSTQWIISLFWGGLIIGRIIAAWTISPRTEVIALRACLVICAICIAGILAASSLTALLLSVLAAGICLGPVFPLLLVFALQRRMSARAMGIVLASCGLGGIIFPAIVGFISDISSLRMAMLLPFVALFGLLILEWRPQHVYCKV